MLLMFFFFLLFDCISTKIKTFTQFSKLYTQGISGETFDSSVGNGEYCRRWFQPSLLSYYY